MIVVDQKVRFDAYGYVSGGVEKLSLSVTGTVVGVNYAHQVFHVVFDSGITKQRTSFKFCDIGTRVQVVQSDGGI